MQKVYVIAAFTKYINVYTHSFRNVLMLLMQCSISDKM